MSKRFTTGSWFSLCLLILFAAAVAAQEEKITKAQVMILGVYHFHNPNADLVKTNFPLCFGRYEF